MKEIDWDAKIRLWDELIGEVRAELEAEGKG